jgi:hypothetical protein
MNKEKKRKLFFNSCNFNVIFNYIFFRLVYAYFWTLLLFNGQFPSITTQVQLLELYNKHGYLIEKKKGAIVDHLEQYCLIEI